MLRLWSRLPIVVRAVLAGAGMATAGVIPWVMFSKANGRFLIAFPWAVIPTALYLWVFWRWAQGAGPPRVTAEARRTSHRANAISGDLFGMAIFAGIVGFAALVPLLGVLSRLVTLNQAKDMGIPHGMPMVTVFFLLVMASIVAGVVEETAFRGYLQRPIERRHGPVVAILVTAVLFGLGHFRHHPDTVLATMPYYVAVAAIYGAMAYFTDSILPGLVLHVAGNVLVLNRLWMTGQGEWQLSAQAPSLIWDTGPDAAFWVSLTALILLGAAAIWAFAALAAVGRRA